MRTIALVFLIALSGCAHFSLPAPGDVFARGETPHGSLGLTRDLAVANVEGTPEEIGAALAGLAGKPVRSLLSSWGFVETFRKPFVASVETEVLEAIPADHRRELEELARRSGVEAQTLLSANAVADTCLCTAFVALGDSTTDGSVVMGRNMDFAPADLLGKTTLVTVVRPRGKKAFVSIGWPGMGAVVSGMNEDGLCAAILINHGAKPVKAGTPLGFVVRRMLEECATVEEAAALFRACPPASDHFVTLADARSGLVVSRESPWRGEGCSIVTCSNGEVDARARVQSDARGRALADLCDENRGAIDATVARRILGATYLRRQNVHAMVFEPARRQLHVARGTTFAPAATGTWQSLDLAPAFTGGAIEARPCASVTPFPHYTERPYRGVSVERELSEAKARPAAPSRPAGP